MDLRTWWNAYRFERRRRKLVQLRAELTIIRDVFKGATEIPWSVYDRVVTLETRIAVLEDRQGTDD